MMGLMTAVMVVLLDIHDGTNNCSGGGAIKLTALVSGCLVDVVYNHITCFFHAFSLLWSAAVKLGLKSAAKQKSVATVNCSKTLSICVPFFL